MYNHIMDIVQHSKEMNYQIMKRSGGNVNARKLRKLIWKGYILYNSNYTTFWKLWRQ